jgi:hypothetical protein
VLDRLFPGLTAEATSTHRWPQHLVVWLGGPLRM